MPRVPLARHGARDPLVDRADQAGLAGERQEHCRQAEPVIRMVPAHERLEPDDAEVLDVDQRLPVQNQLVAPNRLRQRRGQAERGAIPFAIASLGGMRAADLVAPGPLGFVHRRVC